MLLKQALYQHGLLSIAEENKKVKEYNYILVRFRKDCFMYIRKDNFKGKLIAAVLLVAWMLVIFIFSAMPAEASDEKSRLIVNILEALGLNTEGNLADMANHIVRKSAHFIEYALLYFFALNLMRYYFTFNKALLMSLAIVFLYACTDEFHQLFVPGRAGRFSDVMIDTAGGITAMVFYKMLCCIRKKS